MAAESIKDILHGLARQRGRSDANPLVLWRAIDATPGSRAGHVPVSQQISHAWVRLTGDPFRPHQAAALATLRRGEPVALRSAGPAGGVTARLLVFELLQAEHDTSALLVLPTADAMLLQRDLLAPMNAALGNPLPVAIVDETSNAVQAARARIILATPEMLHARLLQYHDRAWKPFWQRLRVIWLDEAHTYHGVAGAHIAALLLRCTRLCQPDEPRPRLLATLAHVAEAEAALAAFGGQPWRVVPVDDVPTSATALAVWRGGSECHREAATLAQALCRAGYSVHLSCTALDLPLVRQLIGEETANLSFGPALREAQVQVIDGYPGSQAALRQVISSGAQATVLVLGSQPGEETLARLPDGLLAAAPPSWTLSATNTYVVAQHLVCAANEQPVTQAEVDALQADELVVRLERQSQLIQLPESPTTWQPRSPASQAAPPPTPYAEFSLAGAGSASAQIRDERGNELGTLAAPSRERWGFMGASLPPGGSRYRVMQQDEVHNTLVVRPEIGGRRTYPLRRCEVRVRDTRDKRTLRGGRVLAWGRVSAEEETYGYREVQPGGSASERTLTPPLATRWTTHAVWVDVDISLPVSGQLVGWSLAAALPLRLLTSFTDVVAAYDETAHHLYFIDAYPGGSGLAAWLFAHLEELLPLAYDIALDSRSDTLLEPLARTDMDWLLLLLGGDSPRPATQKARIAVPDIASDALREETTPTRAAGPVASPKHDAPPARATTPSPETPVDETVSPLLSAAAPTLSKRSEDVPPRAHAPSIEELLPPVPPRAPASAQDEPTRPAQPAPQTPPAPTANASRRAPEGRRGRQQAARQPSKSQQSSTTAPNDRAKPTEERAKPAQTKTPTPQTQRDQPPPARQTPQAAEHASEPAPPTPAPPPTPSAMPSASAMIARMRELRQQREQHTDSSAPARATRAPLDGEARFKAGDRVLCVPYGNGMVRESRIEDGQEILEVDFPAFGALTIDPAVSLVRMADTPIATEEE